MSFDRNPRTYGSQVGSGGLNVDATSQIGSTAAFPHLASSVEFIRQAHAELAVLADALCGPGATAGQGQSPSPPVSCLADALDSTATELDIIAASVAECAARIRSRLIG